jgi:polyisoprenoid-binding protein YceI
MKKSSCNTLLLSFVAITGLFITGCGNPADEVTPADVKPAAAVTTPAATDASVTSHAILAESKIDFVGSKVTGKHEGGFKTFSGALSVADGTLVAEGSAVEIDMTSTWSDAEKLTGHLKSPDFFDVEKFPSASFTLSSVEAGADGKTTITGNMMLHGVTKSITFPADVTVAEGQVSLKAEFSLKRFDFDIKYPGKADDLIREEVVIKLDVQAK